MSTTSPSISSSGGLTTNSTLTNDLGTLQESGLASGVNSTAIIEAEMAVKEMPLTNIENEISGITSEDSQLTEIQTELETVSNDALALSDVMLFNQSQSITSTNSSLVSATGTSSLGAVIGSSTIAVTQLASAASRTYAYTSPSSDTSVDIDGQSLTISAGESAASVASTINSSENYDVYATTTTDGSGNTKLVLSSRSTGQQSGSGYIDVTGDGASDVLAENTALANAGQNAEYSINGGATQTSSTDTISNALPGINLTLSGVTGSTPVTITASNPSANSTAIISSIEQFVADYNTALATIESAIDTTPSSESDSSDYNPNSGSLFGDDEMENLLSDMRASLISTYGSSSSTYQTLSSIGISTGGSTGSISASSAYGYLTVNTATLTAAITNSPSSVKSLLQNWSNSFQDTVDAAASPFIGAISNRISGNQDLISNLQDQYDSMQVLYSQEEETMVEQWSKVEAALEELNQQKSSLTSFVSQMEANNNASSS